MNAFPDEFFAEILNVDEWIPFAASNIKNLVQLAWAARRLGTVRKLQQVLSRCKDAHEDAVSIICEQYPETLHQEIRDLLFGVNVEEIDEQASSACQ